MGGSFLNLFIAILLANFTTVKEEEEEEEEEQGCVRFTLCMLQEGGTGGGGWERDAGLGGAAYVRGCGGMYTGWRC